MAVKSRKKTNKQQRGKRRIVKVVSSVLVLVILIIVGALIVNNNGKLSIDALKQLFSGSDTRQKATEFSFDAGTGSVFADMDGGLAVGSSVGLRLYDHSADLIFSETFEMANPTICTGGKSAAAYDLGGDTLKLFDASGIVKSITADGPIISSSLSSNGWLALCTQESGFKGRVTVYNDKGDERFKWYSAQGYMLSAEVSPDSKSLAVLTLTEQGSRIVFFALDSEDEKAACTLARTLAVQMHFINNTDVLTISESALTLVKFDGSDTTLYDFTGKYLTGYTINGSSFSALVLSDYLVGDQGSIVTIDNSGNTLGVLDTERKAISISANGEYLTVLFSDGLIIYDEDLNEIAQYDNTAGAVETIMRSDGTALVILAHSACVYAAFPD